MTIMSRPIDNKSVNLVTLFWSLSIAKKGFKDGECRWRMFGDNAALMEAKTDNFRLHRDVEKWPNFDVVLWCSAARIDVTYLVS